MQLSWHGLKYKIYMPFGSYSKRGKFLPAYIYPTVIIAIIVLIVIMIVMKYTKFGRSVYAIGGNEQSALMMGLNVKRTKMAAYLLDGFLAGLGGFLFCMNSCAGFVDRQKVLRWMRFQQPLSGVHYLVVVSELHSEPCSVY